MGRAGNVSGANEARGEVRSCRLRRRCLGAAVVLAIACGGLQLPAFAAPESIDAGVMMPTPIVPRVDPTPASIVREDSALTGMPAGSPLWAIPLRVLNETRDRPLFSPSRRPPPTAVVAGPVVAPRPPTPVAPDHPALTLVGTVVGGRNSIGIFVDQTSKNVIRLRIGQDRDGWTLRAIHKRDAVGEENAEQAVRRSV
jgi:general secretion pathway protein N